MDGPCARKTVRPRPLNPCARSLARSLARPARYIFASFLCKLRCRDKGRGCRQPAGLPACLHACLNASPSVPPEPFLHRARSGALRSCPRAPSGFVSICSGASSPFRKMNKQCKKRSTYVRSQPASWCSVVVGSAPPLNFISCSDGEIKPSLPPSSLLPLSTLKELHRLLRGDTSSLECRWMRLQTS